MNWNANANSCFACLTIIIDNLFRLPFSLERESMSFYIATPSYILFSNTHKKMAKFALYCILFCCIIQSKHNIIIFVSMCDNKSLLAPLKTVKVSFLRMNESYLTQNEVK